MNEIQQNSAPAIQITGLTKRYGDFTAVDNLSLSVPSGVIYGFLGPNGAGKSTTIGCLTGLLDPTSGSIELLGERFSSDAVVLKRRIGVMPEGLALLDQLYADEFLVFQAQMFGLDKKTAQNRTDELLQTLGLADTRKKRIADFSTGMRKKIAFAAAVIHSPEILFLDEPFESIDPTTVAMLKEWLRRFAAGGRTVFMTSHVLETVEKLCNHVAIIKEGKLAWNAALNGASTLEYGGQQYASLEEVFLTITGRQDSSLSWM